MRRRAALLLLLALALAGCTPPEASPTPSATAAASATATARGPSATGTAAAPDMTAALLANTLPVADPFDLARRLRGASGQPSRPFEPVRTTPPDERAGTSLPFWTYDFAAEKNVRITATLRIVGERAKWWVQDGVDVDLAALRQNADVFDTRIYPTDRARYGSEWTPGIDGDPRVNVLVARIPGAAAGYFSSADELPRWVNQYSSEREVIYLNSLSARSTWDSIIAHEFCHMIQYGRGTRSAVWFDEGQAQLCEQANGFTVTHAQTFIRSPDTQLNAWPELEQAAPSYGQAFLFLEFLRQHAGGDDLIDAFLERGIATAEDLDRVLVSRGQKPLQELYADFVAANAFVGTQAADGATSYPAGAPVRAAATADDAERVAAGGSLALTVRQYAARYVALPRAAQTIRFSGTTSTKLLPTDPRSGRAMWWSDRADGLDSTLTRTVDLRSAKSPTLSFWTWYRIERDYDYAYVAVSTDGGGRWEPLAAPGTTTDDPNGANLGNGFTGSSGGGDTPQWVREEVDLSKYAGKQVLLRFEYVTDQALNLEGFAVDDIEIPGVFADDAETDGGWRAAGFVRSTNAVAQRFVVQLLRFEPGGATVLRRVVDGGTLQLDVDTTGDRRSPLLAVTGFAARTTERAAFEVAVDAR